MAEAWETFFREAYLRFSPHILNPARTQREVEGIQRLLDLPGGAAVLDLACGPGRITVPMARAGYRMTGLDASETMLGHARQLAEEAQIDLPLVHGDMRNLPWIAEFDAIINTGTAFGYFYNEADDDRALEAISRALKPAGLFLIDTENRDRQLKMMVPRIWVPMGPTIVLSDKTFDPISGRWRETLRWQEGDGTQEAVFDIRMYTATELIAKMRRVGLELVKAYGGLDGSTFTHDSSRMVLVARKGM